MEHEDERGHGMFWGKKTTPGQQTCKMSVINTYGEDKIYHRGSSLKK